MRWAQIMVDVNVSQMPRIISDYLHEAAISSRRPAYLQIDRAGRLMHTEGDLPLYGLAGLIAGQSVEDQVDLLVGMFPLDRRPLVIASVALGPAVYADVHLIPAPDSDWVLFLDVTEQAAGRQLLQQRSNELSLMRQKLDRQNRQLARSNADLDEFASIASHDLRAPLRAVNNLSQWLEEDLADHLTEQTRQQMALMRDRVRRMAQMIDDLLKYAQASRPRGDAGTVNTAKLVADILLLLDPPRGFSIDVDGQLPTFKTVKAALSEVLMNLIGNAIKHHDREDGCIRVAACDEGQWYRFAVSDDGPGIAPQYHDRVFELFRTVRSDEDAASTGLGLALVRKLVERYGGQVGLDSKPGRGSTFFFTWPKSIKDNV